MARTRFPVLPGYVLLEEIGKGGQGKVYKAHPEGAPSLVMAIKVLREHANEAALKYFRGEAEAAARLSHPNIVRVLDIGEHNGSQVIKMEFVEGGNLAALLRKGRLGEAEAAKLLEILARAMHAAHERGIIHRDLKPSNVLLTSDGRPKITDFGLARFMDETLTGDGIIMGTAGYMSPEQARGRNLEVSPLWDVYALGAILFEVLAGRPPFRSLAENLNCQPPALHALCPTVSPALADICMKCLEKDPRDRYPSAEALADDLRRFRDGEAPNSGMTRGWQWLLRSGRPVLRGRAGSALVLLGALAVGLTLLLGVGGAISQYQTRTVVTDARIAEEKARDLFRDGKWNDAVVLCDTALQVSEGRAYGRAANLDLMAQIAHLHLLKGENLQFLNELDRAIDEFDTTRVKLEGMNVRTLHHVDCCRQLARAYHLLGSLDDTRKDPRMSLAWHDKALTLREEFTGPLQAEPDNSDDVLDLAATYGYRGDPLLELSREPEAWQSYEKASELRFAVLEVRQKEYERDRKNDARKKRFLDAGWLAVRKFGNAAAYHVWMGKLDDAIEAHKKHVAFTRHLTTEYGTNANLQMDIAQYTTEWVNARLNRGDEPTQEMEDALQEALDLGKKLAAEDPKNEPYRMTMAWVRLVSAKLQMQKKTPEGRAAAKRALDEAWAPISERCARPKPLPDDHVTYAALLALSGTLAEQGVHIDKAPSTEGECYAKAIKQITLAVDGGFLNVQQLRLDRALKPLAFSSEYQIRLEDLDRKKHPERVR